MIEFRSNKIRKNSQVKMPAYILEGLNHIGEPCLFPSLKESHIFRGVAKTDEDFYYIVEDTEGETHYITRLMELKFYEE